MENKEVENDIPSKDERAQTKKLPVDRGWAWVILAATWTNQLLVNGTYKTFGIIFIEIQQRYGASASKTSLIAALNLFGFGLGTILVQSIGLKFFSSRQTVMVGSLVTCVSYVISAFSPVVELLMLFQGFVPGIGTALIFAPSSCLVGQYFDKKRGLAMCVSTAGGSAGMLVYSLLLRLFLDMYGLPGTLLLIGAMALHGMVSGALQRPLTFYTNRIQETKNIQVDEEQVQNQSINNEKAVKISHEKSNEMTPDNEPLSPLLIRARAKHDKRIRTYSQTSQGSMVAKLSYAVNKGQFWRFASCEFSSSILEIDRHTDKIQPAETKHRLKHVSSFKNKIKTIVTTIILPDGIRKPKTLLLMVSGCLLSIGCGVVVVFLPAHAIEIGLSGKQASLLISVTSVCDIVAIPIWGIIADRHWIQCRHLVAIAATILGITTFFLPLYTSFRTMIFFSVMYGLFGRVWFSMLALILVDQFGLENLNSAMGLQLLGNTITNAVFTTLLGLMRDKLGSYIPCYQLMASVLIVGSIGMLSLRFCDPKSTHDKHSIVVKTEQS